MATKLDQIDTVMFDKTGTLTQGKISVATAQYWANDDAKVAELVAAVEQSNGASVGAGIGRLPKAANNTGCDRRESHAGIGVQAQVAGHTVSIGNQRV